MNNIKQLLLFVILFLLLHQNVNSQWQNCGNYTGYVLPFTIKDSVLIAGTYGSGVYYTNNGTNWDYSTNGMTDTKILTLTINENYVFAGSEAGGVYRSSDNGVIWTPVNNGLTSFEIHTICANAGNVYAGTNTGVYMTSNNGANWTKISFPSVGNIIFAVNAYNNIIIATSINGVFKTTDGGANWSNITSGIASSIYCLTNYNNTVYAGSSNNGVYKTTNDGLNWTPLNSGLPGGKAIRAVFCENEKIYAAVYNSGGIYYLPMPGNIWIPANNGLTQLSCYTVIVFKNYVYAGTYSGIFKRPKSELSSIKELGQQIPDEYKLYNNYPNPFNPRTVIRCQLPVVSNVLLKVYDIQGREVQTLVNERLQPGTYEVTFDGKMLNSGVYFYKLETGNYVSTKRMILLK